MLLLNATLELFLRNSNVTLYLRLTLISDNLQEQASPGIHDSLSWRSESNVMNMLGILRKNLPASQLMEGV